MGNPTTKRNILISPMVLPEFRVPLYNRIAQNQAIDLTVAHGSLSTPVFTDHKKRLFGEFKLLNLEFGLAGYSLIWQQGFVQEALKKKYDTVVVQGNFGVLSTLVVVGLRRLLHRKTLIWMCAYERPAITGTKKRVRDLVSKAIVRLTQGSLCYSSHARDYLRSCGMPAGKIRVVGNTVDISTLRSKVEALDAAVCRSELGLGNAVVLFVGKFTRAKQIDLLLRAVHELVTVWGRNEIQLVLVGDGPARLELEALAQRLKIAAHVRFEGVVLDGKEKYFCAAHLAVMPGSGGLFINECMAASLPIVLSYSDGTHYDLISDGNTGILFERDNHRDLAVKIKRLLDAETPRQSIARKAEQKIMADYTIDRMATRFRTALIEL